MNVLNHQDNLQYYAEQLAKGEITVAEANIQMVLADRVRIVKNRMPKEVRQALNEAVKQKRLCHKEKEGHKPEVYYHPNFEYLANEERANIEKEVLIACGKIHIKQSEM